MKTNKSFTKRLKVTKTGKVLARSTGKNHLHAKESRSTRLRRRRSIHLKMTNKTKSTFLGKS